ncbi:enoyl-CoA hydratase [Thermodesulfobacteriota bacterium]
MEFETLIYSKSEQIAKILLNRPEVRNAENKQMSKEILEAFKMGEADSDVKVIVLAGAGPSFSSGHDLGSPSAIAEKEENPMHVGSREHFMDEEDRWLKSCLYIRDIPKPTIAMVQGHCIMGGFMLATICDLIIAADNASFAEYAVRMGGAAVEYFSHPWELGIRRCKEFLFTAEPIGAEEALRVGLVNRVVPLDNLEAETMALAQKIAAQTAASLKFAKMAANYTQDLQGFRSSIQHFYNIHQLTHAHRSLEGVPVPVQQKSARERIMERDKNS